MWTIVNANIDGNIQRASGKYKRVSMKPSEDDKVFTDTDKEHLRDCTKACTLRADCLTAVYDSNLRECTLYGSNSLTTSLSAGQSAVTRTDHSIVIAACK